MKALFIHLIAFLFTVPTLLADEGKVIRQADGSITFVVDEGLEPIEEHSRHFLDGKRLANVIAHNDKAIHNDSCYKVYASSFANAANMAGGEKDAFFQCVLKAYKKHQSLTLSPDMIWLLVSQGFARYVNAHSQALRPLLVSHSGKMDLTIETDQNLLSGEADCEKIVGDFASEIAKNTTDSIASLLTADFSTTLPAERIASQVTLMESVKSYFQYTVIYAACGIPTITLKGTPADWRHILDKTRKLARYELSAWTNSLEPILEQFVLASEGKPNQTFWQSIVKKAPISRLKGDKCSREKPTTIDGWLLKLFPDENGLTLDSVSHLKEMPSERVYVALKYRMTDPQTGFVVSEMPMELMAGFIGEEVDTLSNTLTPKIGWLLRRAETEEDLLSSLQKKSEGTIDIKVKEVPEMLTKLPSIKGLSLTFTDGINLPEWFNKMNIGSLVINGTASGSEHTKEVLAKISEINELFIDYLPGSDRCYLRIRGRGNGPDSPTEASGKAHHIKSLTLDFDDKVVLPEWLQSYNIDELTVYAKLKKAEKRKLSKQLKSANVGKFQIFND